MRQHILKEETVSVKAVTMAIMFPYDITGTGASVAAKRLFEKLQQLPDDHLVYFSEVLPVDRKQAEIRTPDFIVISPRHGLVLIAIEGLTAGQITRIEPDYWYYYANNKKEAKRISPYVGIKGYLDGMHEYASKVVWSESILSEDKAQFSIPVHTVIILSQITKELLGKYELDVIESDKYIFLDELRNFYSLDEGSIIDKILNIFGKELNREKILSDSQLTILRRLVNPSVVIDIPPSKAHISGRTKVDVKDIDLIQERNASHIGSGHRVIKGVAGSGKTIVIIARARLLSKQGKQVLVLCFNRCLSSYLESTLKDYQNIKVLNFDRWALLSDIRRRDGEIYEAMGERLQKELATGRSGEFRKYDAILIDEGQDFTPSFYRSIIQALKDPFDGDLLIVFDPNQGLYQMGVKGGSTWKSAGINALGRTITNNKASRQAKWDILGTNYRNTKEIAELANEFAWFLRPESFLDKEEDVSEFTIDVSKCKRFGEKPFLVSSYSFKDECNTLSKIVVDLLTGGGKLFGKDLNEEIPLNPSEITILYPGLPSKKADRDYFNAFRSSLNDSIRSLRNDNRDQVIWLTNPSNDSSLNRVADYGLKIQTINSAKGLQNKVVIVMAAHLISDSNREEGCKKFYVAVTRPEDYLVISYSDQGASEAPTEFLQRLRSSALVEFRNRSHKPITSS